MLETMAIAAVMYSTFGYPAPINQRDVHSVAYFPVLSLDSRNSCCSLVEMG